MFLLFWFSSFKKQWCGEWSEQTRPIIISLSLLSEVTCVRECVLSVQSSWVKINAKHIMHWEFGTKISLFLPVLSLYHSLYSPLCLFLPRPCFLSPCAEFSNAVKKDILHNRVFAIHDVKRTEMCKLDCL